MAEISTAGDRAVAAAMAETPAVVEGPAVTAPAAAAAAAAAASEAVVGEERGGDPGADSTRATKPGTKRLLLTLSVLFSFLLGLPFLLKTTEIYRSPLPFSSIESLSSRLQSDPPALPCRFQAVFLRPGGDRPGKAHAERLRSLISEEVQRTVGSGPSQAWSGCGRNHSVSVAIDSGSGCARSWDGDGGCLWRCGAVGDSAFAGGHEAVDELLESVLGRGGECSAAPGGRIYTVVVAGKEDGDVRTVVGKHRHAWITGSVSEVDAVSMMGKIFVKVFVNGGAEEVVNPQGKGEFMPVGSDGSLVLSFSLLNANPNDWVYDWEFEQIDKALLGPVVEALAPLANINVESQVNSNEWHLDTSAAAAGRSKLLHFVVYVPSTKECPLLLRLPNGEISMTNGFISPDLQKLFQVFLGQLRLLFGLRSDNIYAADLGIFSFLSSKKGFTEWELDFLFRQHACFNLLSCATTLESLSKLVKSLPRMIVMEEIGKQVKFSLEAASSAQENASMGLYDASAVSSRKARALAEDAFFHPSIMSISYSSVEHYFAIYMPFFAPVSLHILLAALKEMRRFKMERAKYFASSAGHPKAS